MKCISQSVRTGLISIFILCTANICNAQTWSDELLTIPEKTNYEQTSLYIDVMNFIQALSKKSDLLQLEFMATTIGGKKIPLVVMAEPPVISPVQAEASGKPVVYLQGNIHAGEVEGKEALLQIMREIALGSKRYLLSNQILLVCPIYNADGNDKLDSRNRRSQHGSPKRVGERRSGEGHDLNRDAIKAEALETKGLIKNCLIKWDPILLLDMHTTNGSWHGYSLTYAPTYTQTAHPGPRTYVQNTMLPVLRKWVLDNFNTHVFLYGGFSTRDGWPPKSWNQGGYSANAWFVVNYLGLRNRMAILAETFAHDPFEKRIASAKAFALSIIEYTNKYGHEMKKICRKADDEVVESILKNAGKLKKGVQFDAEAFEKPVDIRVYDHEAYIDTITTRNQETGKEEKRIATRYRHKNDIITIKNVANFNKFASTKERIVPKGYLFPAELRKIAEKLQEHGITVTRTTAPVVAVGEEFIISDYKKTTSRWMRMDLVSLEGSYRTAEQEFPSGTYHIDLAQPLAFLAFYMLEPEVYDGLALWGFFNDYFSDKNISSTEQIYPVFKYYELKSK